MKESEFLTLITGNEALFVGAVNGATNWKDGPRDIFTVYAIRCLDSTIYIGQTGEELTSRIQKHKDGTGAIYTRVHGVEKVVYSIKVRSRNIALETEMAMYALLEKLGFRVSMGK